MRAAYLDANGTPWASRIAQFTFVYGVAFREVSNPKVGERCRRSDSAETPVELGRFGHPEDARDLRPLRVDCRFRVSDPVVSLCSTTGSVWQAPAWEWPIQDEPEHFICQWRRATEQHVKLKAMTAPEPIRCAPH